MLVKIVFNCALYQSITFDVKMFPLTSWPWSSWRVEVWWINVWKVKSERQDERCKHFLIRNRNIYSRQILFW